MKAKYPIKNKGLKKTIFLLLLIICGLNVFSQYYYTKEFEIELPEYKVTNSLYNKIIFIDSRVDTTKLGIVQKGLLNKQAKLIAKTPLPIQVENILHSLIDDTAKDGELLLQIRNLTFAESTKAFSEKGFFAIKANLFAKENNNYQKLYSIDTLIVVKSADVTKKLLKTGGQFITDLIANQLTVKPKENKKYTLKGIIKVDSIEKRNIKVYNVDKYTDGVYYSYESFKNQEPDKTIIAKQKNDLTLSYVKVPDKNDEWKKIKPEDVYAVVYNGQPYIATKYGYYGLFKSNGQFYFAGKVSTNSNSSEVFVASYMFGIIGGIIASSGSNATYFIIIDHSSGEYIYYRKMVNPNL